MGGRNGRNGVKKKKGTKQISEERNIKRLEAFEGKGLSNSEASKLAYKQFTGDLHERIFSEEEEQQMLEEIEAKKKGIK